MARSDKIFDDPVRVHTVIDRKQHEFLKMMCYRLSLKEKKRVTMSDLLRRAAAECFPTPKDEHLDLFNE